MHGSSKLRPLAASLIAGLVLAVHVLLPGVHARFDCASPAAAAYAAHAAPLQPSGSGAPRLPAHDVDHCLICFGLHQAGSAITAVSPLRALEPAPALIEPLARLDARAPRVIEGLGCAPPRAPPARTLPIA